jgi:nucleoside-diphosphate-sugar epimerase
MTNLTKHKILVTGGTGFAGKYAIRELVDHGHSVFALVRSKEKLASAVGQPFVQQANLKVIEIENPEKLQAQDFKNLLEKNDMTTIVHIAALAREYSGTPWTDYFETNVLWTKNLALAFLDAKINRNKFIFTSSVGVYGTIPQHTPADEQTPYNPDGKYHKSKMLAEQELLKLQSESNLPLVILRPSIMYGVGDFGFLYKMFSLSKKKIYPLSSRNPRFHMLDVERLAEVYAKMVEQENSPCGIFNVSDQESVEAKTLVNFIKTSAPPSNYLKIPSSIFSFFKVLSRFNAQRSITFKLINESWFYNVERLNQTLGFESKNVVGNLQEKYLSWYTGGA